MNLSKYFKIVFIVFFFGCNNSDNKNAITEDNLFGNIKSIKQSTFEAKVENPMKVTTL